MNAFVEDWRAQIRSSVVESARLWVNTRDVELTHGLLPVAVFWPIRQSVRDFDLDVMNIVREIIGENAKLVLPAVQSWGDDRLMAARELATQTSESAELGTALNDLNTYFDVVPLFANALAQTTVAQHGGNVYNISGQIKAGLLNIGGELNVDSLTLNLAQSPSQAEIAEQQHQRVLLKRVRDIWIKGVLANSLHDKVVIELGKGARHDAVERPWGKLLETPSGRRYDLSPDKHIQTVFDDLGYAMLILGAPGAGKTTMLLELARTAISGAEETPGQPIPVVFNLSSWGIRQPPLEEWLAEELNNIYEIPTKLGQAWVEQNVLMLLLDGLDEVQPDKRAACVNAINAFRTEHGIAYIAVCSRIGDYETLTIRLRLNGAIVLLPLTSEQVDEYFTSLGSQYETIRTVLRIDPSLQELAHSPLMLNIIAMAYANESVEALTKFTESSIEASRRHVFDLYVEKMLMRRKQNKRYSDRKTLHWLEWLASQMQRHNLSIFMIERLQPTWLPRLFQRILYRLILMDFVSSVNASWIVGAAIIATVLSCIGLELVVLPIALVTIVLALLWCIMLAFQSVATKLLSGKIIVVETLNWSWTNLRKHRNKTIDSQWDYQRAANWWTPTVGLFIYLILGGVLLAFPHNYWYLPWLVILLMILGIVLLFRGLEFGQLEMTRTANEGIQRSVRNATIVGLWGGIAITPMAMFLGKAVFGGWFAGIQLGILVGACGWLWAGGWAFLHHFLLRLLFWGTGCLPGNLVSFLDYASERIFLQKVGGGYIFTHRLLMEYFVTLHIERTGFVSVPIRDWHALINLSNVDVGKKKAPLNEFLESNPWAILFINIGGIWSLVSYLSRVSWTARVGAASSAVQLGIENGELVKGLFVALKEGEKSTGLYLGSMLKQLGAANSKILADLMFALQNKDSQIRSGAALALGLSGTESNEVVAALLAALGDDNSEVLSNTLSALIRLDVRNNTVVPGLLTALQNEDCKIRARAAFVLGKLYSDRLSAKYEMRRRYLENHEQALKIIITALKHAYHESRNSQLEDLVIDEVPYSRVKDVIAKALEDAGKRIEEHNLL